MSVFEFIKKSLQRKIARRVTREYPVVVESFEVGGGRSVRYGQWKNPLVKPVDLRPDHIEFFSKFLKAGDLAIDIGANVGQISVLMSLITGRSGLVVAFDPNPFVFNILKKNIELNPELTHIEAFPYAICESEKELYYASSEASFNNGGISETRDSRHGRFVLPEKIRGIHLESFLNERYPDRVSRLALVKIDTEGFDKEIIKAIDGLLVKYRPAVISECFSKTTPEERAEHFEVLVRRGYKLIYFSDFSSKAEFVPILTAQDMNRWRHFDFYAIPN